MTGQCTCPRCLADRVDINRLRRSRGLRSLFPVLVGRPETTTSTVHSPGEVVTS